MGQFFIIARSSRALAHPKPSVSGFQGTPASGLTATTACAPGSRAPYHVRRRPTATSIFAVGISIEGTTSIHDFEITEEECDPKLELAA